MTWSIALNETALADIGVYVQRIDGLSAPARDYPSVAIPGRMGVIFSGDPTAPARSATITASIVTTANTIAARRTAEDQLKALAYRALVKITYDDDVNAPRAIDGVCTACVITTRAHPTASVVSDVTLSVMCPDPTWYDVAGQLIAFTSTPSAIPLGTAPSGGIVRIAAPSWSANVVNPVLTYLNAAGVTLQTLTMTGTLTAGTEYLEIDLDRCTITEYSSGTGANAISWLSSGDFFGLDPMDGDVLNASYPQLKVTSASGTPSATWAGVRRWL